MKTYLNSTLNELSMYHSNWELTYTCNTVEMELHKSC